MANVLRYAVIVWLSFLWLTVSLRPAYNVAVVIPTVGIETRIRLPHTQQGVGATVGGYAGDALPAVRTLASVADCVITHPNTVNAAMLYYPMVLGQSSYLFDSCTAESSLC